MRSEEDLRAALRLLEREAPSSQSVLRKVMERTRGGTAGPRRGRRLLAAAAAAAVVVAFVAAAVLVANRAFGHRLEPATGESPSPSVSPSVSPSPSPLPRVAPVKLPRYYMTVVPGSPSLSSPDDALVLDSVTGAKLATVRPPRPFVTFISVTGAADDRTFVLTAQSAIASNPGTRIGFYEARFNPSDNGLTLSPLTLRGLPDGMGLAGAALSTAANSRWPARAAASASRPPAPSPRSRSTRCRATRSGYGAPTATSPTPAPTCSPGAAAEPWLSTGAAPTARPPARPRLPPRASGCSTPAAPAAHCSSTAGSRSARLRATPPATPGISRLTARP